jgi:hypothetical protein
LSAIASRSEDIKGAFLDALSRELSSHYQAPSDYSDGGGYSPYSPPPSGVAPANRNQHAYDVGYRVGQDDFHRHLTKHFTRHDDLYDPATHDAFGSGYESGYDRARSEAIRLEQHSRPRSHAEHAKSENYPSGYYPYSPPPKNAPPEMRLRHAYEVGYRVGQDDFNTGHSKHYTRHEELYEKDTKNQFKHGYEIGYDKARARAGSEQDIAGDGALRAAVGQGKVAIKEGSKTIAVMRTASPNVEKHRFYNGRREIVVKSRGNHGPATVELFDVRTGTLRDKVLAFAIRDGNPEWARGMED